MSPAHRWLLKWARVTHVYLTLFGLVLLLFFAVTGFMLNHEDWFSPAEPVRSTVEGTIASQLLREPDRLGIVEQLRKNFGARGEVDSFEVDKDEDGLRSIRVVFKAPSRFTEASISVPDGQTQVNHETRGLVGLLLDLHRGKSSGPAWSFIIDGVSIAFVVVSVTGLFLWSSLRNRARYGLIVVLMGLAVSLAVYFGFVPR